MSQRNFKLLCVVMMITLATSSLAEDCDRSKCPGDQKLYKELDCKPIYKDGECCAVRYECKDLSSLSSDKCLFNGKEYNVNSEIPNNETMKHCAPHCRCTGFGQRATFLCAHYDCAEFFAPRDPNCIFKYEVDSCCSTGQVCGDEKEKLARCYLEGNEYHEGQQMFPESVPCYECLCKAGFDNSTIVGNQHCKEVTCGLFLHYHDNLVNGCVPIYYGNNRCCPIDFRCPENETDEVISEKRSDTDDYCTFGKLKVFVGDELKSSENKIKCTCVTPPHVQCIKERDE